MSISSLFRAGALTMLAGFTSLVAASSAVQADNPPSSQNFDQAYVGNTFVGSMVASLDYSYQMSFQKSQANLSQPLRQSTRLRLGAEPLRHYPQRLRPGLPYNWQAQGSPESTDSSDFSLSLKGHTTQLNTTSLFVMPGETASILAKHGYSRDQYEFNFAAGSAKALNASEWNWTAPQQPGLVQLLVSSNFGNGQTKLINAFVMVPASNIKNGKLEGYKIGQYPEKAKNNNPKYLPPKGFIRVTKENQNTLISPHFRLKQFLCKQAGGFPKFVVLQESLLYKLEHIVDTAKANGFPVDTLHVMSGYRTPFYNKAIGNVKYSRHQWGDAADVFIDIEPSLGVMDDLNYDHKHDIHDAKVMASWVNNMRGQDYYRGLVGGLGIYKPNSRRGAFIHVDVRGSAARW